MIGIVAVLAVAASGSQEAAVLWSGDCEIHFKDASGVSAMPVQYGWTVGEKTPFMVIPSGMPIESGKYLLTRKLIPEAEGTADPDVISSFSDVRGELGKTHIEGFESFRLHKKSRMIELKYLAAITFANGVKRDSELDCSLPYPSKTERAQ